MAKEFRLPDLGEGVHEGQIVRLLVQEGQAVAEDQPLMEVETDKAAVEIPSPVSGSIAKWHVKEQQTVSVGDVMVTFGSPDEQPGKQSSKQPAQHATQAKSAAATATTAPATAPASRGVHTRRTPASPAVRKLARSMNIDLERITGSGPGGRVTREDVHQAAAASPTHAAGSTAPAAPAPVAPGPKPAPEPARAEATGSDQYGPISRIPISQARKTIAAVMSESMSTIPHVTDSDDADVTALDKLRKDMASDPTRADLPKVTMLAFVIRAVARALRTFPEFNASFDAGNQQVIHRHYINIAVGVHTQRGLVAPVIRDADQLDVPGIAAALADITEKARAASFAVNDTRGGTYTISNAGAFGGSRYSTPLITPPQVAVLAIGRSRLMPWVVDGVITPRLIMPLSHSIDHRLLDGGQEIAFMKQVIGDLEHPGRLLWGNNGRR